VKALEVAGFRLRDTVYDPAQELPPRPSPWASLCLTVEGGYVVDLSRMRLRCGPGSLVFQPAHEAYGGRISDAGSHCFTVAIAPDVFRAAAEADPTLTRLDAPRSAPPNWLAFQLHAELEAADDLAPLSVESAVLELLAALAGGPALEARGAPPPWLERVKERIQDEFKRTLTLAALAETAAVHRVHLARAFRQHYGCTVGDYIRRRRVEFASHRLTATAGRLSDIAFDAGFADQSHFTNTFRRLVGLPPAAFRSRFTSHRALARR
jgi:AraC-like DNA-binding protein